MAQITVKNTAGKDAGKVDLDDSTFGIQPNVPVMHQVVTAQLAARRAGTQSTKTRSEVRGGGAKPFPQKGTGNARQGSIRAPHYVGGGVAHGPKPRKYLQKTPKKMIRLALRSALSDRAAEGKIVVIDEWGFDKPSTKAAKAALTQLGIDDRALIVIDGDDAAAALSFRNLTEVQVITAGELNAYDVLCNEYIVFTQAVLPTPAAEVNAEPGKAPTVEEAALDEVVVEDAPVDEIADEVVVEDAPVDEVAEEVVAEEAAVEEVVGEEAAAGGDEPDGASASDESDGDSGDRQAKASPDVEEEEV